MNILAIESSCDETAVALYAGDAATGCGRILAEQIASQIETHARFGGVVPEVASREHLAALPPMVDAVMQEADLGWNHIDAIAVTSGPGLMGALLVGTSFARAAACVHGIPVLPVHHMEGHLLAPGLAGQLPAFPFITLLVSGGHTMLVRVDAIGSYSLIGQTLDDAAGECFDKSARLLGLPYPGGPEVARLARDGDASRFPLPRPMLNKDNLDFSFSGLKTAVMYAVRKLGGSEALSDQERRDMAAAIEEAICDVLVSKALRACRQQRAPRLVIAGGVAANSHLRGLLASRGKGVELFLPELRHCTDNAAMIAYAAFARYGAGAPAPAEWDARPRWPLHELTPPHTLISN
ncbi:tRNA (adenosine(37)-N6)-threonylcarbamoyltransferase complex transferase subunit TsaD [Mariprofundus erugo]|uniref:tRNA (adenosine(37)-N6)-threonylcarbamoyltransferase complex transferase subunit TsaD n=1 Tax=Mariprofundus erugo TaxID=2528639 RepID=UPI0010FD66AB|nr:tRNA (adenosine(37)-N6)-threonylcarbamoyltransferase complex transferase subunit TsaD [Mariprofundus erugo]TLS74894.1 tRNA (adenosine(37)-N6)-threonylcarbamoyltransferase complex transferase subunit TsaD [Mariprofundus erugo]